MNQPDRLVFTSNRTMEPALSFIVFKLKKNLMSTASPDNASRTANFDTTYLNARREAFYILIVWIVAFSWTILYCHFNGYQENVDPENLNLVLGIPSWVFWGIAAPWFFADIFTLWYALSYIKDDDLGEDPEHPHHEEQTPAADSADTNASDSQGGEA